MQLKHFPSKFLKYENAPELLTLSCWLFKEINKKQFLIYKIDIYEVEIIYTMVFENYLVAS